jgi:UDP-N-acetylmuramoylalanine-D-glutamate ligase
VSLEAALQAARAVAPPRDGGLRSPASASVDMFQGLEHPGDVFRGLVGGLA